MIRKSALLLIMTLYLVLACSTSYAQAINIFGNNVPKNPTGASAVTLGVKFWSSQAGTVSGIRFYRGEISPLGYVANLYSSSGTLLGSVKLPHESGPVPGWQVANFAAPISIAANITYIAAYYSPSAQGAADTYGLQNGATNGPLTAPASSAVGGNGVYKNKNAFPNYQYDSSNYYVDVSFIPTTASLVVSLNPPNPSIPNNTPLGSTVATISATWSDGAPFTGTLSFGPPYSNDQATFSISGNNLIINPSGPGVSGDANTVQNITIVATQ